MKQYHYERVEKPKRSGFDLSKEHKFTMNIGELVPCYMQEVIPGDKINLTQEALIRMMPQIAPIMHRVNVFTHFFYVPNRIVWKDWDTFITGEEVINFPRLQGTGSDWALKAPIGSLSDHFGIPVTQLEAMGTNLFSVSQLPYRAYAQIFNDYYRDQNLQTEVVIPKDELNLDVTSMGADAILQLRLRSLEKDYFTSALPTPQFGEAVTLPLGGTAPVTGNMDPWFIAKDGSGNPGLSVDFRSGSNSKMELSTDGTTWKAVAFGVPNGGSNYETLQADLSMATATSVSDLRRAYALQRYQEKLMRGGRRLKEWTLNIFGVNVPDERIQRAEYLGGGKMPVNISEVIQTFGDDTTLNPLGGFAGHGIAGGNMTGFSKYFVEHGYIIGIMSILPRTGYFQGVPKSMIKFDKFDYYTPDFAHIGEQAILGQEIYLEANTRDSTFGYTPRYAEYRDNHDTIAGEFRTTLKHWHMARDFQTVPTLSHEFIEALAEDFTRVFAVQSTEEAKFLVQTYLKITAIRPVSKFGDPY